VEFIQRANAIVKANCRFKKKVFIFTEYLDSKYQEFGIKPLHPVKFTGIVQNKIGNLRQQALKSFRCKRNGKQ
jgi:hypothetical protein